MDLSLNKEKTEGNCQEQFPSVSVKHVAVAIPSDSR